MNRPFLVRAFSLCLLCIFLLPIPIVLNATKNVKEITEVQEIPPAQITIRSFNVPEITPVLSSEEPEEEVEVIPTSTPTPTPTPAIDCTEADLDLLSRLIRAEVGVESYKCKLYVGSVILNRMQSDEFPDTLEEVIYQRRPSVQFSTILYSKKLGGAPIDLPADEESIRAAKEILEKGSILPDDVQVFYADYCDEGWVTSRKTYEVVDTTVFAYIYK